MVILLAIGVGVTLLFSRMIRQQDTANNLVTKPWEKLSGMIECGVWTGCGAGKHPSAQARNISLDPSQPL